MHKDTRLGQVGIEVSVTVAMVVEAMDEDQNGGWFTSWLS
jgi:hypothetical protein